MKKHKKIMYISVSLTSILGITTLSCIKEIKQGIIEYKNHWHQGDVVFFNKQLNNAFNFYNETHKNGVQIQTLNKITTKNYQYYASDINSSAINISLKGYFKCQNYNRNSKLKDFPEQIQSINQIITKYITKYDNSFYNNHGVTITNNFLFTDQYTLIFLNQQNQPIPFEFVDKTFATNSNIDFNTSYKVPTLTLINHTINFWDSAINKLATWSAPQ